VSRAWAYLALAALLTVGTQAAEAAPPEVRIRQKFDAGWLFARQAKGAGELGSFDRDTADASKIEPRFRGASAPVYDDSWWESIDLPHTWNAHDVSDAQPGYWRGIGWYRKHFRIDPKYRGKKIVIEFEGVNAVSEFWLNGKYLGRHAGGYTGFTLEIAPRFGPVGNVLTAKVDNLYRDTVPPTVKTDYSFYGGIYRDVWLRITETTFVSDIFWRTPTVNYTAAEVEFHCQITNLASHPVEATLMQEILDADGKPAWSPVTMRVTISAGQTETFVQSNGPLKEPKLWSPQAPNLYVIRTSLTEGSRVLDVTETPLGFRWFRFDPEQGFFLNGKRVQIQGTNWHQSYPGMGNALPKSRHVKDMEMIRDMGANFWRTSHYPHNVATIEASDRLGLMVWEELPINKEIGNPDEYVANVSKMAREMIRRDRNRPSVILWGIAGEINASKGVSRKVVEAISKLYRELDPTRLVAMHAPRGDEIEALVDVVGADVGPETDRKHLLHPDRAYMVSEYSAALIGRGLYGGGPASEELGLERHEKYLGELNRRSWMAGGCIWHQFDYDGETYDPVMPHVVAFGMADIWRIPKEVYFFYQSQWAEKPMVHIVGHWTWPGEEGKVRTVKVYSNVDEVELFLNGTSLGSKANITDPALRHPAHIWQVPYTPGTLRAVAKAGAKEIADERKTAGAVFGIRLEADTSQVISGDPESLAYITALVVDERGEVVPGAHPEITFTLYGPGRLLEQTWLGHGTGLTWNAVDGRTRVAFRSTSRSGRAVVSAYSPGLRMGRIEIEVTAPGKRDEMNYRELSKTDEIPQ
jgi:beta-galactosidase